MALRSSNSNPRLCDSTLLSVFSVFSVLAGAHSNGAGVLVFVSTSTRKARVLRLVSRDLNAAVAAFPWRDPTTIISGSIASWHSSFPRAIAANLSGRSDLKIEEFELLNGVLELDLTHYKGESVALEHCSKLIRLNLG